MRALLGARARSVLSAAALLLSGCGELGVTVFEPLPGPRPGGGVTALGAMEQRYPALAVMGPDYLLTWSEPEPAPAVRAARVRPADEEVQGEMIAERSVSDVHLWPRASDWLLSAQGGSRVMLLSVTSDLEGFDERAVHSANSSADLRTVPEGDALYGVWTANVDNDYDVWGGLIDPDNTLRAGTDATLTPGRNYEYAPEVARVGGSKLLIWLKFSSMVNYNYDINGRWLDATGASFVLPAEGDQRDIVSAGGSAVALIVWWDSVSQGLVATRARPDGTLVERRPVSLWPSAGRRAAIAVIEGGFLIVGPGLRDGVPTLRLLIVDESSRIEPERAVWLAGGELGTNLDRPAVAVRSDGTGLISFAQGTATSTVIHSRRFALRPLASACRAARECLSSRCVSGLCSE